ncbi:MAG: hypothetical protein ACSLEW_09230 [Nocardioides sp.]
MDNPLLTPSALLDQYPPFDLIRWEHFEPAIRGGMTEHLAEIEAIAANPAPATFANTIEALELSGLTLARASRIFDNLVSADGTAQFQDLDEALAGPRAAAFAGRLEGPGRNDHDVRGT